MALYSPTGEGNSSQSINMMSKGDYAFSESFKQNNIIARIVEDWHKDDNKLINSWIQDAEKYRPSSELIVDWTAILTYSQMTATEAKKERKVREIMRLEKNIEQFQKDFVDTGVDFTEGDWTPKPDWIVKKQLEKEAKFKGKGKKKEYRPDPIAHGKFLPNSLATALINKFRVRPGDDVTSVQRALATLFCEKKLNCNMSVSELVEYVEKNGGFSHFSKEVYKHPMIF